MWDPYLLLMVVLIPRKGVSSGGCYQLMTVVTPLVSAQVKLGLEPDSAAV